MNRMFSQLVHKNINPYILCIWVCPCIYQLLHKFHVVIIAGTVERCPALVVGELSKSFWLLVLAISSVCAHKMRCTNHLYDHFKWPSTNSVMYCQLSTRDCKVWNGVFNLSVWWHADYVQIYLTAYICTLTTHDDYNCKNLWARDSCMKRWCIQGASTDLLNKASHLTVCILFMW